MYHIFTFCYIILFLIKVYLLKNCDFSAIGDRLLDIIIVCSPALLLVSEWALVCERVDRQQHRPLEHMFDMVLQSLFVGKIIYKLSKQDTGRALKSFVQSHLIIGPCFYA